MNDILVCPHCYFELRIDENNIKCESCGKTYKIELGVPDFRSHDSYWHNVSREKMQELVRKSIETGDWFAAMEGIIPTQIIDHVRPYYRADGQFLWPITPESRVLDAGSMWGGITVPVAQFCKEVYAVDQTLESLAFLKIRAEQLGLDNVKVVASPLKRLPFPDSCFDIVILSGVLEWVAFEQEVVLERDWGKKRNDKKIYFKNPRDMQIDVLKELNRVLKPGGSLCLAIENAIGYPYLIGYYPDDHVNLKFTSFLPRYLANLITKWKLNCEYRTYTYSGPGLVSLLREGGFQYTRLYGVFNHYIEAKYIIPFEIIHYWKDEVLPYNSPRVPKLMKIAGKIFPNILLKHVSPSFMVLASKKETGNLSPRVVQLIKKAGLLKDVPLERITAVKYFGRMANCYPVNYLIYIDNNEIPVFFCKLCRDKKDIDIMRDEIANLQSIDKILINTELSRSYPKVVVFTTIDNITFSVTEYVVGKKVKFNELTGLSNRQVKYLDKYIKIGINFLVNFQKRTKSRAIDGISYLLGRIDFQSKELERAGKLSAQMEELINVLIKKIRGMEDFRIPLSSVHGDYDFDNILFLPEGIKLVDFEHFEKEGFPLYDFTTLIFNPILIIYNCMKSTASFDEFLEQNRLRQPFSSWINQYSMSSGIPPEVVRLSGPLVALECQTKVYPAYRNPETLPMYPEKTFQMILSTMLKLQ